MLKDKPRKYISALFISAEAALGTAVQLSSGVTNRIVSFSAILLAAAFVWIYARRSLDFTLSATALVFTTVADFFLVLLTPMQQLPAMIAFLIVQGCYFAKIMLNCGGRVKNSVHIAVRGAVSVGIVITTVLVLRDSTDALAIISMLYFANLVLNVIFGFINSRENLLLPIGLLLFLLCDIFVGLSMIDGYLPVAEGGFIYALAHPPFNAAWLFYVPAQTLLALSANKKT